MEAWCRRIRGTSVNLLTQDQLRSGAVVTVTDGPFTESKEVIGGWAILNADSKAEAVRVATEFMELHRKHWPGFEGESEVRPMFDHGMGP